MLGIGAIGVLLALAGWIVSIPVLSWIVIFAGGFVAIVAAFLLVVSVVSPCSKVMPAMAKLIYCPISSLDGYIEDADGKFDWAAPDEEVHTFVNDLVRPVGTYLLGRRMYETMVYWASA